MTVTPTQTGAIERTFMRIVDFQAQTDLTARTDFPPGE
jgi:hypothetical protein